MKAVTTTIEAATAKFWLYVIEEDGGDCNCDGNIEWKTIIDGAINCTAHFLHR